MTQIVKAPNPADFLALVPQLIGIAPRQSVVLVAFRGNRTCCALRFDLPSSESTVVQRRVATTMLGMLHRVSGVDGVAIVVYTDRPALGGRPHNDLAEVIERRAEYSGLIVRDALFVAEDEWGRYADPRGRDGSERVGGSVREISSSTVIESIPADLRLPDTAAALLPPVDLATSERVARFLREFRGEHLTGRRSGLFDEMLLDVPEFFEGAIVDGPDDVADWVAATVIALVQSGELRDIAMLQWAFGPELGGRLFDGDGDGTQDAVALMLGRGPRPDPERLRSGTAIAAALAARAPRRHRVVLLAMLAWLHWASGRSSAAAEALQAADAIDPAYGFSDILRTMIFNGMMAEWVFEDPYPDEDRAAADDRWRIDEVIDDSVG